MLTQAKFWMLMQGKAFVAAALKALLHLLK
jgi:hypothetical protein